MIRSDWRGNADSQHITKIINKSFEFKKEEEIKHIMIMIMRKKISKKRGGTIEAVNLKGRKKGDDEMGKWTQ